MTVGFGAPRAAPGRIRRALLVAIISARATGLQAQGSDSTSRPDFIFFRYASLTSLALYGAYGHGNDLLVFGMVQNPRTHYGEIIGGLGTSVALGSATSSVLAVAVADATDSWYAQLYALPTVTYRRLSVYGSFEYYAPLQPRGAQQLGINPLLVMARVAGPVQVGGAWLAFLQPRIRGTQELGASAQLLIRGGRVTIEVLRRLRASVGDVRVTFQDAL